MLKSNTSARRTADSTETPYRYAAYATRIRTILLSAHRYVAYTSDIGESFRPVAHPWLVRSAYGISWAYLAGDVANEGYKAYVRNRRILCPQGDDYRKATSPVSSTSQDSRKSDAVSQGKSSSIAPQSPASRAHPMPWNDPDSDTWTPWKTTRIPLSEDYRSVMAQRAVFSGNCEHGIAGLHHPFRSQILWPRTQGRQVCSRPHLGTHRGKFKRKCNSLAFLTDHTPTVIARPLSRPILTLHLRQASRTCRRMGLPQRILGHWRPGRSAIQGDTNSV